VKHRNARYVYLKLKNATKKSDLNCAFTKLVSKEFYT
jgi:hypothetical protein